MSRSSTLEALTPGCSRQRNDNERREEKEPDSRGQTEPLAALVAVAAIALAIGVYGFVVTDVVDSETERTVGDQSIDLIWDDIQEQGAYPAESDLGAGISQSSLPEGYNVYVNISQLNDEGEREEIAEARFAWDGDAEVEDPPEGAGVATRPVSIRHSPGDVSQGTLRVEVWEP